MCSTLLPLRYFFWQGGIIHVLPHPKERTGGYKVVDHEQKKPRNQFSPLGDTCWYHAPLGQTVTAEFHPLGPIWQEVQDPVNDTVGELDLLKFGCQSSVINEIKSLAVIGEENNCNCRNSPTRISCFPANGRVAFTCDHLQVHDGSSSQVPTSFG